MEVARTGNGKQERRLKNEKSWNLGQPSPTALRIREVNDAGSDNKILRLSKADYKRRTCEPARSFQQTFKVQTPTD